MRLAAFLWKCPARVEGRSLGNPTQVASQAEAGGPGGWAEGQRPERTRRLGDGGGGAKRRPGREPRPLGAVISSSLFLSLKRERSAHGSAGRRERLVRSRAWCQPRGGGLAVQAADPGLTWLPFLAALLPSPP